MTSDEELFPNLGLPISISSLDLSTCFCYKNCLYTMLMLVDSPDYRNFAYPLDVGPECCKMAFINRAYVVQLVLTKL